MRRLSKASFYDSYYVREKNDFYSTDPIAIDYLMDYEIFDNHIWECACGNGNLSKRLESYGYTVYSTDKYYHGYGKRESVDFLKQTKQFDGDIITNPPYKYATEFILKALELTNNKVAMFCKIQLVESYKRYEKIFKHTPPSRILPFVNQIDCYRNDDRTLTGSTVCYAWFVWEKDYDGECIVRWIDNL